MSSGVMCIDCRFWEQNVANYGAGNQMRQEGEIIGDGISLINFTLTRRSLNQMTPAQSCRQPSHEDH